MRKIYFVFFSVFAISASGQLLNPQSREVTERFYPNPDIEIPTPAFSGSKVEFTDYDAMMDFLNPLVLAHPDVAKLSFIGESQRGKEIPMLTIERQGGIQNKLHVWMQGSLHGDEPGSTEAMLYLIHELLNNPGYAHLLDRLVIGIVPMANVDGANALDRDAANGLDLNRDQTKLMAPESVALKAAFHSFRPQVAVDFHEYRPHRRDFQLFGEFGVNGSYDVMFLYSGNLNVPEVLRNYTKDQFVKSATLALDGQGLTHHDYFSTRDYFGAVLFNQGSMNARSSATNYALSNVVSTLIEVRGVGLGTTSFKRRVNSAFTVATSYLESAYQNVDEVREVLQKSASSVSDAVLEVERPITEAPFDVIDNLEGERVQIMASVRDAGNCKALSTRPRPVAYVLPEGNDEVVQKLRVLGVEVLTTEAPISINVEAYRVSEYWRDGMTYEGIHQQDVQVVLEDVEMTFPAGTHVILMDQVSSNMCIEVLEPETPNSFVAFGVIETELGATLPYFRSMNELPLEVRTNK